MFKSQLVMLCVNVSQAQMKFPNRLFTNLDGFFIRNHALVFEKYKINPSILTTRSYGFLESFFPQSFSLHMVNLLFYSSKCHTYEKPKLKPLLVVVNF